MVVTIQFFRTMIIPFIAGIFFVSASGCWQDPVQSGPSLKLSGNGPGHISGAVEGGLKTPDGNGSSGNEPVTGCLSTGKSSGKFLQLEKELLKYVPSGFVALGVLSSWPFGNEISFNRLPVSYDSRGMAHVLKLLMDKASSIPLLKNSETTLLEKSPMAFAFIGSADGHGRFMVSARGSQELDELLGSFPVEASEEKDVRKIHLSQDLSVFSTKCESTFIIASDMEIIKGAIGCGTLYRDITYSPLYKKLRPFIGLDACGYVCCDFPALVSGHRAFPSVDGAVQMAIGPVTQRKSALFKTVAGAAFSFSESDDSSISVSGTVVRRNHPSEPHQGTVLSPRLAGETIDSLLSVSLEPAKMAESWSMLQSVLPDRGTMAVNTAIDRFTSFLVSSNIDFDKDLKPVLGTEAALILSWKIRYPQLALLLSIEDSKKWSALMTEFREKLVSDGYVFGEKNIGEYPVYFTRDQSVSPEILEPAFVITPEFLILASGRRVLDSILIEQEKLEGTPIFWSCTERTEGEGTEQFSM